jgi:hypothetical protein
VSELHTDIDPDLLTKRLTPENWLDPDPANSMWVRLSVVGPIQILPQEWAERLLEINVADAVPLDVRRLFAVARGAMLYGSFFYPLWALGSERLFVVADAAVAAKYDAAGGTRRANGRLPTYHARLMWLRDQGLLDQPSIERWEMLRMFRNSAAHPEAQTLFMPTHALTFLTNVAGDINALFT